MIMKQRTKSIHMSALAPLLLFAVFASCVALILLFGADIYRNLSQRDQDNYQRRTAVQYVTTRIRQSDAEGMVFIGDFYEATPNTSGDTLFICEELDGKTFYTRIYCSGGYLRELFGDSTLEFAPEDGEIILQAQQMCLSTVDDTVSVTLNFGDGTEETVFLNIRTGKEIL